MDAFQNLRARKKDILKKMMQLSRISGYIINNKSGQGGCEDERSSFPLQLS
jgi:hypothetical protein